MDFLEIVQDMPTDMVTAMKLFHKTMGRDNIWSILHVLSEAETFLTQKEISEKIKCTNIGKDLRFLTYIRLIDRTYVCKETDHTYTYAINYDVMKKYSKNKNNYIEYEFQNPKRRTDFIKKFTPKKRIKKTNK